MTGPTIGYATLQVIPSMTNVKKHLGGQLQGVGQMGDAAGKDVGSKFSSGFGAKLKVAGAIGAAFAAVKVKDFLGDAIGAASDLAESTSKVDAVFGDSADAIKTFASTAATGIGESTGAALEAAGTFGNLFTSLGLTKDAAAGMSTDVLGLAADLGSFNNLGTAEVLEKLRAGLTGEMEPLKSMGIAMNAASVEAKALELGLADASGEISESAKVQARLALITESSSNALGDWAKTSGGLAGQQKILSANMEDLKAKIGTALLPAVTTITSFLADKFVPGVLAVGEAIGAVAGFIAGNIEYFTGFGIAIAAVVVPALWAKVAALAASAVAWAATGAAMLIANAPLVAIVAIIGGLTAAVVWAYQNVDVFRDAVDKVARFVTQTVWPAIKEGARIFTDTLIPAIQKVIGFYWDFYSAVFETVGKAASFIGEKVGEIVGFFSGLGNRLAGAAGDVFGFLRASFRSALNFVIDGWNSLEFKVPGFDPPGPGPKFGGFTLGMPDLPRFDTGGIVPGRIGEPQLALVHGGETILPTHKQDFDGLQTGGRSGATIINNWNGAEVDERSAVAIMAWELGA